jgi:hypothetical protein
MRKRILHLLIAIDQLLWVVITLGAGYPDETISSASYRGEQKGNPFGKVARPVIDWLFYPIEKDHCRLSYEAELNNNHLPKTFEELE